MVTGVDLHEEVIKIAESKAGKLGLKARFIVCDARELSKVLPSNSFDAATMFFSSISYMIALDDLLRLLKSVKYVLRDGGVFIADFPNPYDLMFRLGKGGGERRAVTWDVKGAEEGEHVVLTDWKEVKDRVNGIIRFKRLVTIVKEDGSTKSYLMSDNLRLYTPKELELAATQVGFREATTMCYLGGKLVEPSGDIAYSS